MGTGSFISSPYPGPGRANIAAAKHGPMPSAHTKLNIDEIEDAAIANGLDHRWEARVAREPLEAETGVTHFRLKPGKRSPFAHRHGQAEEVYVILAGRARSSSTTSSRRRSARRDPGRPARRPRVRGRPRGPRVHRRRPHYDGDGEPVDDPWVS